MTDDEDGSTTNFVIYNPVTVPFDSEAPQERAATAQAEEEPLIVPQDSLVPQNIDEPTVEQLAPFVPSPPQDGVRPENISYELQMMAPYSDTFKNCSTAGPQQMMQLVDEAFKQSPGYLSSACNNVVQGEPLSEESNSDRVRRSVQSRTRISYNTSVDALTSMSAMQQAVEHQVLPAILDIKGVDIQFTQQSMMHSTNQFIDTFLNSSCPDNLAKSCGECYSCAVSTESMQYTCMWKGCGHRGPNMVCYVHSNGLPSACGCSAQYLEVGGECVDENVFIGLAGALAAVIILGSAIALVLRGRGRKQSTCIPALKDFKATLMTEDILEKVTTGYYTVDDFVTSSSQGSPDEASTSRSRDVEMMQVNERQMQRDLASNEKFTEAEVASKLAQASAVTVSATARAEYEFVDGLDDPTDVTQQAVYDRDYATIHMLTQDFEDIHLDEDIQINVQQRPAQVAVHISQNHEIEIPSDHPEATVTVSLEDELHE